MRREIMTWVLAVIITSVFAGVLIMIDNWSGRRQRKKESKKELEKLMNKK